MQESMPSTAAIGPRVRAWAGFLLGALALGAVGGVSLVSAGGSAPPPASVGAQGADAQGEQAGHSVQNHGRCVSAAAHAANDAGLRGPARGEFMRSIAQDSEAVADKSGEGNCDFGDALGAATTESSGPSGKALNEKPEKAEQGDRPAKPSKPATPDPPGDPEPEGSDLEDLLP